MEVYRFIYQGDAYSREQPSGQGECTCKLGIKVKYGITSLRQVTTTSNKN